MVKREDLLVHVRHRVANRPALKGQRATFRVLTQWAAVRKKSSSASVFSSWPVQRKLPSEASKMYLATASPDMRHPRVSSGDIGAAYRPGPARAFGALSEEHRLLRKGADHASTRKSLPDRVPPPEQRPAPETRRARSGSRRRPPAPTASVQTIETLRWAGEAGIPQREPRSPRKQRRGQKGPQGWTGSLRIGT